MKENVIVRLMRAHLRFFFHGKVNLEMRYYNKNYYVTLMLYVYYIRVLRMLYYGQTQFLKLTKIFIAT